MVESAIALAADALARGLLYTADIKIQLAADRTGIPHTRHAGANVGHLLSLCRASTLFQVAHAGGLFCA
jgi:hypothetical protein